MKFAIRALLLLLLGYSWLAPSASAQTNRRRAFADQDHGQVKITNGPIVETLKSDSASIAWSTNLTSNSKVAYGVKPSQLDQFEAEPPDGKGLMHRVQLTNLQPGITYYFQIQSRKSDGESVDSSKVLSFTTPAVGAEVLHNEIPH